MKASVKGFVCGVVVTAVLGTSSLAMAAVAKNIDAYFGATNLFVNGVEIEEPTLFYDGTNYLPLRAVAEALGMDVEWVGETQTAYLTDKVEEVEEDADADVDADADADADVEEDADADADAE